MSTLDTGLARSHGNANVKERIREMKTDARCRVNIRHLARNIVAVEWCPKYCNPNCCNQISLVDKIGAYRCSADERFKRIRNHPCIAWQSYERDLEYSAIASGNLECVCFSTAICTNEKHVWKELGHVVATVHSDEFVSSAQPHVSFTDKTLASICAT